MSGLPPDERARRYRELAAHHLYLSGRLVTPEASAAHLELAALWTRLATEAERQAHAEPPDLGPDLAAASKPDPASESEFRT